MLENERKQHPGWKHYFDLVVIAGLWERMVGIVVGSELVVEENFEMAAESYQIMSLLCCIGVQQFYHLFLLLICMDSTIKQEK